MAGKKEDLMVTENTGLTPAQLAADKSHRQVAFFLVGIPETISLGTSIFFLYLCFEPLYSIFLYFKLI